MDIYIGRRTFGLTAWDGAYAVGDALVMGENGTFWGKGY